MRTVNGERVDSVIMLEFQEPVLPGRVKIGCMSFPVRPYIPPPLRWAHQWCARGNRGAQSVGVNTGMMNVTVYRINVVTVMGNTG